MSTFIAVENSVRPPVGGVTYPLSVALSATMDEKKPRHIKM